MNDTKVRFLDPSIMEYFEQRGQKFEVTFNKLLTLGSFCTNVKALQEVVYRYHLIGETKRGYELAKLVRDNTKVFSVTKDDIYSVQKLLKRYPTSAPRELLHTANMANNNIKSLVCAPTNNYTEIDDVEVIPMVAKLQ